MRSHLRCRGIEHSYGGVALLIEVDEQVETSGTNQVLLATGWTPNTAGLDGVDLTPSGGTVVDERMRATESGINAARDTRRLVQLGGCDDRAPPR